MFCWLVPRHEAEVAQRHGREIRLPRQRVRNDAATSHPSGSIGSAIPYTVHSTMFGTCRQAQQAMVGGGGTQSRLPLPSSIVAPGGLANANHLSRHDAHNQEARRLVPSVTGNQSPRTSRGYLRKKKNRSSGRRPRKGKRNNHNPQASEKHQRQGHNRQKHQRPARRATATSSPASLPRGSWDVMPAATQKFELHLTGCLETKGNTPNEFDTA